MRILLYGFKRFGRFRKNVSEEILKKVRPRPGLAKKCFVVDFDPARFLRAAEKTKPYLIIGIGQAPSGKRLSIESVAHNSFRRGRSGGAIIPDGPKVLKASFNLPTAKTTAKSRDAGAFVCNYAMYLFEDWARCHGSRTAFLHIPLDYPVEDAVAYLESVLEKV